MIASGEAVAGEREKERGEWDAVKAKPRDGEIGKSKTVLCKLLSV